jgi:hypothetical protein
MMHKGLCSVASCGRASFKKEWCDRHYKRWWRHGDPLAGGTPKGELRRYLDEVVLKFDGEECLLWPYSKNGVGYGQIRQGSAKLLVHRIACEDANGPAPSDLHEAAHNCGFGHAGCCNPTHLRWATRTENRADIKAHGSSRSRPMPERWISHP